MCIHPSVRTLVQRAVNSEIATIKDTIRSNQATGKIRMQWWRERIYDLYASPLSSSPPAPQETFLLRGLAKAIDDHDLTRRWFERLLDARVRSSRALLSCLLRPVVSAALTRSLSVASCAHSLLLSLSLSLSVGRLASRRRTRTWTRTSRRSSQSSRSTPRRPRRRCCT